MGAEDGHSQKSKLSSLPVRFELPTGTPLITHRGNITTEGLGYTGRKRISRKQKKRWPPPFAVKILGSEAIKL